MAVIIDADELKLYVLPARNPNSDYFEQYENAYNLWKKIWIPFWKRRGQEGHANSDTFIRQDDLCAIFYRNECIALTLQYVSDFRLQSCKDDSYFSILWHKSTHKLLEPYLPYVYTGNQITTAPQYRRGKLGFSLKDVLLGSCVNCFLEREECQVMVGAMRNDRGVNDLAYRFGAELAHSYFQAECQFDMDLVLFNRKKVHECTDLVARKIIRDLWDNRIDGRKLSEIKDRKFVA